MEVLKGQSNFIRWKRAYLDEVDTQGPEEFFPQKDADGDLKLSVLPDPSEMPVLKIIKESWELDGGEAEANAQHHQN